MKAFRELPSPVKCGVGFALVGFFVPVMLAVVFYYSTDQQLLPEALVFFLCPTIGFAIALGNVGVENSLVKILFVAGTNGALYGTIGFAFGLLWTRMKRKRGFI
jgi:hypothetical protein